MADRKISDLPAAGDLTGSEIVPIVSGGITVRTTTQDIADLGGGGGGAGTWGSITGTLSTQTDLQTALDAKAGKTPRVATIASSATPAIDVSLYDCYSITALAAAITSVTISGTPSDFQPLIVRIKDNGTARAITWGSSFVAMGETLPTTTTINKVLTVAFLYDSVLSKFGCVGVKTEA